MRTEVVKLYKDFNVTSVSGIQMVGSCLAEATAVMEEVNLETQVPSYTHSLLVSLPHSSPTPSPPQCSLRRKYLENLITKTATLSRTATRILTWRFLFWCFYITFIVLYCIVSYCILLYYVVLHCIVFYLSLYNVLY